MKEEIIAASAAVNRESKRLTDWLVPLFAIDKVTVQLADNGLFAYTLTATDEVEGYVHEYGDEYESVLNRFTRRLTARVELARLKRAKAEQILRELDAAENEVPTTSTVAKLS